MAHTSHFDTTIDYQFGEILYFTFGRNGIVWIALSHGVSWIRCIASKLPSYFHMCAFLRLPFKSHPPFGYLIVWPVEYLSVFCAYASLPALMCFAVGSCWLVIAFMADIMSDLAKLNRACKNARHDAWELKVRYRNIIQSYSEVKELSLALFIAHKSQNHFRKCQNLWKFAIYLDFSAASMKPSNIWFLSYLCTRFCTAAAQC